MLKKILITVIALSFLLPSYVSAATYFVAPNGNDSNSGTIQQPFKTIQKGVDKLSPGDTLNIRGGTYVEQVNITKGGTAQNPVTIQAYQNEQVTIDGEYRLPNGQQIKDITKGVEKGSLLPKGDGNYKYVGKGGNGQTVFDTNSNPLVDISASYLTIKNIDITRSKGRASRTTDTSKFVTIDGSKIYNIRWHGHTDYGNNNTIKNCEITLTNDFATFSREAVNAESSLTGTDRGLNWGGAIPQTKRFSKNFSVINCIIHDNWGEGIITSTGTVVKNNILYNNYSASIYIEESSSSVISENLIYNTGETVLRGGGRAVGLNVTDEQHGDEQDSTGGQIFNNIIVGTGAGIVSFSGTLSDIDIFNNTVINISKDQNSLVLNGATTYNNYSFRNNIFYSSLFNDMTRVGTSQVAFKTNIWNKRPDDPALAGSSNNSLVTNPLLVDPDAVFSILRANQPINPANYGPKSNSPAIGKATGKTPQRDFFGCLRDSNPDIGAIEYGGTNCNRDIVPTPNTPTPTVSEPTPTPSITPLNKYDVTENGVVDILDIIDVIKYLFSS